MDVKGSFHYFSYLMEEINKLFYIVEENDTDAAGSQNGDMDFVNDWFLMGSRYTVFIILVPYLLFVLKFGPNFMKNREPYELKSCLTLYNVLQIIISCFLCYGTGHILTTYGFFPKTCVMETENRRHRIAALVYYYLLAKVSELLDTVFFVLRKKDKQLSFLHIYHHSLMIIGTWTVLKYEPSYRLIFLGLLNSFVHVIMYTYYGLASFPSLTKYLWWKKYITSMQLVQFVTVLTYFIVATMMSDCPPSYILAAVMFFNLTLFLYLFGMFYINTYNKKQKSKATEKVTLDDKPKTVVSEMDKKLYQNGKHGNDDANGENCKTASINLKNTYRIKFNLESKKWA